MAYIKSFSAVRFTEKAGELSELTCPPYDIISSEERDAYLGENAYNIIRLELPTEGENPYAAAGKMLKEWLSDGILAVDDTPSLYIYEERFSLPGSDEIKSIKGIVANVRLEPWEKGVILPHEETLSKAKTDRLNLMKYTGCNFSSVYSLYSDRKKEIASLIDSLTQAAPIMEFTSADAIVHRVWRVSDTAEIVNITARFSEKKLYIADGHHRYETALNYRDFLRDSGAVGQGEHSSDFIMMTMVAIENPGLEVLPTHRILRGLENFSAEKLLTECSEFFDIQHISAADCEKYLAEGYNRGEKVFIAVYPQGAAVLTLRDFAIMKTLLSEKSPAYQNLNVSILHTLILERMLGIDKQNMASQKNLSYTHSLSEAVESVENGADIAFLINNTSPAEIAAVAEAAEKMPQKSTYFYPKLITGHLMNQAADISLLL